MKNLVALLPMKANSERVAGKNFKEIAGKPLLNWVLDELLLIPEIDLIVINTDARRILHSLGVFDSNKICIRERKRELCGDFISMNAVLADDVMNVASRYYMMTHTTNPLIRSSTIKKSLAQFTSNETCGLCDSMFSVNKVQSRFYARDGSSVNHDSGVLCRTQDLEPWFEENSALYFFSRQAFIKTSARIGERPIMFETPPLESIDIDTLDDWKLAEALLCQRT